ncbi:hypothetical protein WJX73_004591 [Symbiochloris irregularis]|uniref:ADP,ATP carrier protein n=1 Tax=Symbiochloris irregularis TaxID=706552 RepID=A0AAW1P8L6_9CHLO
MNWVGEGLNAPELLHNSQRNKAVCHTRPPVPRSRRLSQPLGPAACAAANSDHSQQPDFHQRPAPVAAIFSRAASGHARLFAAVQSSALGNSKYLPMVCLFFCMSAINTILDSLGNSLVITATGGGAPVLPFLTVYAVWPASIIFLVAFAFASQKFSRRALFNIVIIGFMIFYGGFGLLYPFHEQLHLSSFAEATLKWMPAGMAGAVGMVRNWSFTLFYCSAELWGDVALSLLFWGLANELTDIDEAPMLYPLFGIGANVGQTLAGKMLSAFSSSQATKLSQQRQLQGLMGIIIALSCGVLLLHHSICCRFPARTSTPAEPAQPSAGGAGMPGAGEAGEGKIPLQESLRFLAKSHQIQCLGVMSMSQGLTTNLLDMAWKSHLHMLHSTPAAYAAFMGDVAMWTGIVTGTLMCVSPFLFRRFGWCVVAGATPAFLLVAGTPFFLGCIVYALWHPSAAFGIALLRCLVMFGALLQVFGRGAKFSMFKPAEEMVYIGLDAESRTKGKAAIDVVGAQSGKSIGAIVQQMLLLFAMLLGRTAALNENGQKD